MNNFHAEVEFVLPEHVQVQLYALSSSPSPARYSLVSYCNRGCERGPHFSYPSSTTLTISFWSHIQNLSVCKRKRSTLLSITVDGNETTPEVHQLPKKKYAREVKPLSSLFVVDQEMPQAEIWDGVPVVEIPSSPEEKKPKLDLLFLLQPAREPDDHLHLIKAASVLKSQLVAQLTSHADKLCTKEMMILANKCYNTLEGLGDNYISLAVKLTNSFHNIES